MSNETRDDHPETGPDERNELLLEEFSPGGNDDQAGSPEDRAVEAGKEAEGPEEGSPFELPEKLKGKSTEEMAAIIADNDRKISKQGQQLSRFEDENSSLAKVIKKLMGKGDEDDAADLDKISKEKGLGAALEIFKEKLIDSVYEKIEKGQEQSKIIEQEESKIASISEVLGKEKTEKILPVMALMLKKNPAWRNIPNYMNYLLMEAAGEAGIEIAEADESNEANTTPAPFPRASKSYERMNEGKARLSPRELEILDNYGIKVEDYLKYRNSSNAGETRRKAGI